MKAIIVWLFIAVGIFRSIDVNANIVNDESVVNTYIESFDRLELSYIPNESHLMRYVVTHNDKGMLVEMYISDKNEKGRWGTEIKLDSIQYREEKYDWMVKVLNEYNVTSWDGYKGNGNSSGVFNFKMNYNDGKKVIANGKGSTPEKFFELYGVLIVLAAED